MSQLPVTACIRSTAGLRTRRRGQVNCFRGSLTTIPQENGRAARQPAAAAAFKPTWTPAAAAPSAASAPVASIARLGRRVANQLP
jgi:hypothetical protein